MPTYPKTHRHDEGETLHGQHIPDPYRWLEELDSEQTREWIEAQNELTFDIFKNIPQRESIHQRIESLWNYEKFGIPFTRGKRLFFSRNNGLQNQNVMYWMPDQESDPIELLDPNQLSEDGTIALTGHAVSDDGQYFAYGLSSAGSDWQEWKVREIDTGKDLSDHIKWVKFSNAAWTPDGTGFYYSRYDEPKEESQYKDANYNQKLYYHSLGTSQDDDILIYERPDQKEWGFHGGVTEDGHYLVITVWQGTHRENALFYKDLLSDGDIVELLPNFDAAYYYLGNDGPVFYLETDRDAPMSRIVAIDINNSDQIRDIIPESSDALEYASLVGNTFITGYLHDASSHIRLYKTDGTHIRDVKLPGIGSTGGFGGKRTNRDTYFMFTGFTTPGTIYHYDLETGQSAIFRQPEVDFNPGDYLTEQIFYNSKDGTRVPLFITRKKDVTPSVNTPVYLYGYGGFNIAQTPSFSIGNLVWMEMGGIFAQASLRGGGEYGKTWHESGTKRNKQNVFDDFIAAAEWLIDNNYTSTPKLAIGGGSNGGLLVGACLTQRPDLFGACLPAVGVLDMLRFHKFTIGWAWTSDYGSPDDP
ncbi:MAG: prolyl oligopeptidase family serine peptidase, partial [Candidatus Latescibacteria bacterium]|nr:prolyl oligopeptidase family serine peptidase [Candidatus Latescibacterota bacterium]